ncbi:MAG: hypothetical protein A3J28_10985 [Acidobacteria bacterium RIFCSPLOWO2_12_FULL_60_22]|nr:MAG: hypothetical protein A3J28_10985 [Acidobacteria bacterium RIFCSPLOWO2_12_FULL_60_22]
MFGPLTHPPGDAQADFGEALAVIGGSEQNTARSRSRVFSGPWKSSCEPLGQTGHEIGNGRVRWETNGCMLGADERPKRKFHLRLTQRGGCAQNLATERKLKSANPAECKKNRGKVNQQNESHDIGKTPYE